MLSLSFPLFFDYRKVLKQHFSCKELRNSIAGQSGFGYETTGLSCESCAGIFILDGAGIHNTERFQEGIGSQWHEVLPLPHQGAEVSSQPSTAQ